MDAKTCNLCGGTFSLSEFPKNRGMPDGLLKQCRSCVSAKRKSYYEANRGRLLAMGRDRHHANREKMNLISRQYYESHKAEILAARHADYSANPEKHRGKKHRYYRSRRDRLIEDARAYRRTESGREVLRRAHQKEREQFPDRIRARYYVSNAVRDGRLVKPKKCQRCGKRSRIVAHHHKGYEREHWLDVLWLCEPCHKIEDGDSVITQLFRPAAGLGGP